MSRISLKSSVREPEGDPENIQLNKKRESCFL